MEGCSIRFCMCAFRAASCLCGLLLAHLVVYAQGSCPPVALPAGVAVTLRSPPTVEDLGSLARFDESTRDLLQRTYVHQATWAAQRGRPFVPSSHSSDVLAVVDPDRSKVVCLRRDAATSATRMLAAARAALKREQQLNSGAPARSRFWAQSGYRSPQYQAELWISNVATIYMKRVELRRVGDRYDEASAKRLATHTRKYMAVPGFSNHHSGNAVDFSAVESGVGAMNTSSREANIRAWKKSWFHGWLRQNARQYGFQPYAPEPWHWEFNGRDRH